MFFTVLDLFLIILLFAIGPFCLLYLTTTYADHLDSRGKFGKAYRFKRVVYYFTELPLLRLWLNKYQLLQLLELSHRATKVGEKTAALEWARQGTASHFPIKDRISAFKRLADLLRQEGQIEAAENAENDALALAIDTDDWMPQFTRMGILLQRGQFNTILSLLQKSSAFPDDEALARFAPQRAEALLYLGRYEEAIIELQRSDAGTNRIRESILSRGTQSSTAGKQSTVQKTILASLDSMDIARTLLLIQLCLEAGKVGTASEHWESLPKTVDPLTQPLRFAVGAWFYAASSNPDAALSFRAKAEAVSISEKSGRPTLGAVLARADIALQDWNRAAERLEILIDQSFDKPLKQAEYRALLATVYTQLDRPADARSEQEKVVAAGFEEAVFTQLARAELAKVTDA